MIHENISNKFLPFHPNFQNQQSFYSHLFFSLKSPQNPFTPTLRKSKNSHFFSEEKMYEFGEELIIDSYKVPWLIWIQLLVMILLVLLLFFGFSVLDLPNNSTSGASSSTPTTGSSHGNPPSNSTITLQHRNQNQHTIGEAEASTSREIARADESQERDGSAERDTTVFKLLVRPQHPCNYFGLAKQAFLKCLGFDSDRDNCNTRRHAKED